MKLTTGLLTAVVLCCLKVNAFAVIVTPIDLNDFFADPTVTIAADGSSALMEEDSMLSAVLLSNDPGLGDPIVVIAGTDVKLVFEYDFIETGPPSVNDDEFGAFILDSAGLIPVPPLEFFTQDTSAGTVMFDLSALLAEPFLGLQFELSSLFGDVDFDSTVRVFNVRLEMPDVIPEPTSLIVWSLFAAVLGVVGTSRRRRAS